MSDLALYYLLSTPHVGQSVFDFALRNHVKAMSFFHGGVERALDTLCAAGQLPLTDILPSNFSQVPRAMCEHIGVDTLLATVSSMDADGYFSLGTSIDYSLAVSRRPGARLILEVNPNMPHVRGESMIHVSQVAALVENHVPLFALPAAKVSPTDEAIGAIIASLVDDGACLQMGIGALPDAVCAALHNHRNLGIHTEMMTNGLLGLRPDAARDTIVARQLEEQEEAAARRRIYGRHDFREETQQPLEIAAIAVAAPIGLWREELVDEVAVAARQLDAGKARALQPVRGAGELFHGPRDLRLVQRMGHGPAQIVGEGGGAAGEGAAAADGWRGRGPATGRSGGNHDPPPSRPTASGRPAHRHCRRRPW
ncbi:MAG: hypothetical protein QM690_10135 [Sphingobium sp.]